MISSLSNCPSSNRSSRKSEQRKWEKVSRRNWKINEIKHTDTHTETLTHTDTHSWTQYGEISGPQSKENILKVSKEKAQLICKGKTSRLLSGLSAVLDPKVEQCLKALREKQCINLSNKPYQYGQLESPWTWQKGRGRRRRSAGTSAYKSGTRWLHLERWNKIHNKTMLLNLLK